MINQANEVATAYIWWDNLAGKILAKVPILVNQLHLFCLKAIDYSSFLYLVSIFDIADLRFRQAVNRKCFKNKIYQINLINTHFNHDFFLNHSQYLFMKIFQFRCRGCASLLNPIKLVGLLKVVVLENISN